MLERSCAASTCHGVGPGHQWVLALLVVSADATRGMPITRRR